MSINRALLRIVLTQLLLPFMCLGAMEQPGQEDTTLAPKDLKLVVNFTRGAVRNFLGKKDLLCNKMSPKMHILISLLNINDLTPH